MKIPVCLCESDKQRNKKMEELEEPTGRVEVSMSAPPPRLRAGAGMSAPALQVEEWRKERDGWGLLGSIPCQEPHWSGIYLALLVVPSSKKTLVTIYES